MSDGRIILPGDLPTQTPEQAAQALKPEELPECTANPNMVCSTGATDFMIKGYDDKLRCGRCNELHVELVMQEAGESAPNSEPQFVAPKLDKRATTERMARIEALNRKLAEGGIDPLGQNHSQTKGSTGIPVTQNYRPLQEGEPVDMRDAKIKDEHQTQEAGISEGERRARILAKYGKRIDGNKLIR